MRMIVFTSRNWSSLPNELKVNVSVFFAYLFSLTINLQFIIRGGFKTLPGDRYDGMIGAAVLEHWYQVFRGSASWANPGWQYPYDRVIAHGDASFLNGVLYSPFRLIGIDPFLSQVFANSTMQSIGFFSFYVFARKICKFGVGLSSVGSILFTINNAMTIHSSRFNLASFALIPLFLMISVKTYRSIKIAKSRMWILWVGLSGLLYGSIALTCFYIFFFSHYFLLIFALILIPFYLDRRKWFDLINSIRESAFRISIWAVFLFSSLIPFIYLYFPKSQEVGVRSFGQVSLNAVKPIDLLQQGTDNFLWGNLYNRYFIPLVDPKYTNSGEYYNLGISPLIFFILISLIFLFFKKESTFEGAIYFKGLLLAVFVSWFSIIQFQGMTFWVIPFHLIPGAKALNAIGTLQLVLVFPVLLLVCYKLKKSFLTKSSFALISLVLILGELNHPYLNFDREQEIARLDVVKAPPQFCKVFFVTGYPEQKSIPGWNESINTIYPHNVVAMMLSAKFQLPTINGFASFNAPDWNFAFTDPQTYIENVNFYLNTHKITGVCKTDLVTGTWSQVP